VIPDTDNQIFKLLARTKGPSCLANDKQAIGELVMQVGTFTESIEMKPV